MRNRSHPSFDIRLCGAFLMHISDILFVHIFCALHDMEWGIFMELLSQLENILHILTEFIILILEFMGVAIIAAASVRGFYNYIHHSPETKRVLAKGLAVALEFKMGSEILRTVVVRQWEEIATVAGIILLRAALAFLIHWEIKEEDI